MFQVAQEVTFCVHTIGSRPKLVVSADGRGVVSHAGSSLLADLADATGLTGAFADALRRLRPDDRLEVQTAMPPGRSLRQRKPTALQWPRTRSATMRMVLLDSGSRAWWTACSVPSAGPWLFASDCQPAGGSLRIGILTDDQRNDHGPQPADSPLNATRPVPPTWEIRMESCQ